MADPVARDPRMEGILRRPFAQQAAFFRGKLGNLVPTARWTDMQRSAHDRGFMVAGAQSADLLAGLAAAVDRAIAEGVSIEQFRKDFRHLVQKTGWHYHGQFNWRTRTIYRTNIASSYAAARSAQLREGEFPYLMYKHGGSSEPRPEHLAWDGIVLPANHAFWKTHFAPNGWGCSCRVVGVRSPDAARRMGGDPDKPLPEGWDTRDPETGALPGIDPGWDYRPGETVADAVQQMAAKTQHWDYVLAKAYMQNVPQAQRDALAQAYRALPSVADETRRYAQRILEGGGKAPIQPYRTLGLVESRDVAWLAKQEAPGGVKLDVAGFDWSMDEFSALHIHRRHGVGNELDRSQRGVTVDDFANIPQVIAAPDSRKVSEQLSRSNRQPVVELRKKINGETYVAEFEVRAAKRRTLVLLTLYIKARKP